jgi:phosphoesterase RecJ-like protein
VIPEQRLAGLKSTLERAERPLLVCHRRPDGDAIGSALGLALLLEELGATPTLLCADSVPSQYTFLDGADRFVTEPPAEADLVIMLDCGSDALAGFDLKEDLPRAPLVDIDHHPKTARPKGMRLAAYDQEASSTAEIVHALASAARWRITRSAATALLTGIVTDTSAFRNNNVGPATLEAASDLLRKGARLKEIIRHCFYSSSIAKLRLWGIAMARIEQNPAQAGLVSTILTAEDITETGATQDDLEGLVNFLKTIPGVSIMLLLTDLRNGTVKGSLRAGNPEVDVSRLAQRLGGGGHTQAAGFAIPGRLVKDADDSWRVVDPSGAEVTGLPYPVQPG